MTEEAIADSGENGIDMDAAMADISSSVFDSPPEEPVEATEEETTDAVQQEEVEETAEEEVKTEEVKPEEGRPPPQSWKKDMHDKWNSLEPEMQDYVEQREDQMREGLDKDREDATRGREMRDIMSPYSNMLKQQGINESDMVRNMMNAHVRLSTADDASKAQIFRQMAQSYGVSLDGEPPQIDPNIKAMQDRLQGMEQYINASHEQSLQDGRARVESDVEAFASKHEFFDDVAEQIVPLINAGYNLEDAYQNALWLNPVTRQKEVDRTSKEAAEKASTLAKQEAEKARKLKSVNVRGRDTNKTPTEPTGTMEDTMRETYRAIQNQ